MHVQRLVIVCVLAACGDANFDLQEDSPTVPQDLADDGHVRELEILAVEYRFYPDALAALAGETVRVTLKNEGVDVHNLVFLLPDAEVRSLATQANQRRSFLVTAPAQPGRYVFYCGVGNNFELGMVGTLRVTTSP